MLDLIYAHPVWTTIWLLMLIRFVGMFLEHREAMNRPPVVADALSLEDDEELW